MILKGKLSIFFYLLTALNLLAQNEYPLKFEKEIHDFGEIREEDRYAEHEFQFKNVSDQAVFIERVKASCGCTTPKWTTDTLQAGESGFIRARYSTINRPGLFNKNLTVYIGPEGHQPIKLYIRGSVKPKPLSPEEEFPYLSNGLRLNSRVLNFGRLKTDGNWVAKEFPIYNSTDSMLVISDSVLLPDFMNVSFQPHFLSPGQIGTISLRINASKAADLGFRNDDFTFYIGEDEDLGRISLDVYLHIEEHFPPLTEEELRKSPKLTVNNVLIDMGHIDSDSKEKAEFVITNTGKETLKIRKLEPNCSCLWAEMEEDEIKPGNSTKIIVEFDTKGRKGNQDKSLTVYSNSPSNSVLRLNLRAYIRSE